MEPFRERFIYFRDLMEKIDEEFKRRFELHYVSPEVDELPHIKAWQK
jgi:hypothetical protein